MAYNIIHRFFCCIMILMLLACTEKKTTVKQIDIPSLIPSTTKHYDVTIPEELRVRDGLANFFAKLETQNTVRVGFIGGSVTYQPGWRSKTFSWLEREYPDTHFEQINAAISGTGASFASARLKSDLLAKNPDLVFIEYRINAAQGFEARAIEGLVRQIWQDNPQTDICFVYTIADWMISEIADDKQFWLGQLMEKIANHYGIPSIDLGVEVVKQMKAGQLIFQNKTPIPDHLVFSADGIHPLDAGHELYKTIVTRSLQAIKQQRQIGNHVLPSPLVSQHFTNASLMPVDLASKSNGWSAVDIYNDKNYISDRERTHSMLRGAIKTSQVGETLSIDWHGKVLGFTVIPQQHDITFTVTTDGRKPHPVTVKKVKNKSAPIYAQFAYAPEYPNSEHTTKITVTNLPDNSQLYLGQFIIIADPQGVILPPILSDSDDSISAINVENQVSSTNMTFTVTYSSMVDRTLYAEVRGPATDLDTGPWLGAGTIDVPAGSGVQEVTVTTQKPPKPGRYLFRTHIRPINTQWQSAIQETETYFLVK